MPFCGHATIATRRRAGRARRHGHAGLPPQAGRVPVETETDDDGGITATLTSVEPHPDLLGRARQRAGRPRLGQDRARRHAAAADRLRRRRHLVLAAKTRERSSDLDYDLRGPQAAHARPRPDHGRPRVPRGPDTFHARNPFPVGGVVEDPATGAAAARSATTCGRPATSAPRRPSPVHQGVDMGRPSLLTIDIDEASRPEIRVSGRAVAM